MQRQPHALHQGKAVGQLLEAGVGQVEALGAGAIQGVQVNQAEALQRRLRRGDEPVGGAAVGGRLAPLPSAAAAWP